MGKIAKEVAIYVAHALSEREKLYRVQGSG